MNEIDMLTRRKEIEHAALMAQALETKEAEHKVSEKPRRLGREGG